MEEKDKREERQAALKKASEAIEKQPIVRLTAEESIALTKFIDSEPELNEGSIAAIRLHKKIIGSSSEIHA